MRLHCFGVTTAQTRSLIPNCFGYPLWQPHGQTLFRYNLARWQHLKLAINFYAPQDCNLFQFHEDYSQFARQFGK